MRKEAQPQPGLVQRLLGSLGREPIIEKRWAFSGGTAIGLVGLILTGTGVGGLKQSFDLQPVVRELSDQWLNRLTPEEKELLANIETRIGFLKHTPLASYQMEQFERRRISYIDENSNGAYTRMKRKGFWHSILLLSLGFINTVGGPGTMLAALRRKNPNT